MAKNNFGAGIRFEVVDFEQTVKRFIRVREAFFSVRNAAMLTSKAFAGLRQTFKLAGAAGQFEQSLAAISAITRATSKELDAMRNAAINAALKTQFSPDEAAQGLLNLSTAGFKASESMKILNPVLDLATGSLGQLGLAQAANVVGGTLRAYSKDASDAANVTDKLLRITQLTNFQAKDMTNAFAKAAGSMGGFGQTLDDTLVLMGLLRNMNLNASVSATAVRNAVRRISGDQRVQNLLTSKGIKIMDSQTGKLRSVVDIIGDLIDKTSSLNAAERGVIATRVFGARGIFAQTAAMKAAFTVIRDGRKVTLRGREAITFLRKELGKSGGAAEEFRKKLLSTFEGQKTLLQGVVQSLAVVAGAPFAMIFRPFVAITVQLLTDFVKLLRKIPAPLKKLIAGMIVLGSAFTVLATTIITVKLVVAGMSLAMAALNLTLLGVLATTALVTVAFGVFVAAIGLAAVAFRTNFKGIRTFFDRTKLAIKGVMVVVKNWKDGTSEIPGALADSLRKSGVLDIAIKLGGFLGRMIQFVKDTVAVFRSNLPTILVTFEPIIDALVALVKTAFGVVRALFVAIFGPKFQIQLRGTRKEIGGVVAFVVKFLVTLGEATKIVAAGIMFLIKILKVATSPQFFRNIGQQAKKVFSTIVSVVLIVWNVLKSIAKVVMPVILVVWDAVKTAVVGVWDAVVAIVRGLLGGMEGLSGWWPILQLIGGALFTVVSVVLLIGSTLLKFIGLFLSEFSPVLLFVAFVLGTILRIIFAIGGAIASAIIDSIKVAVGWVKSLFGWFSKFLGMTKKRTTVEIKQKVEPTGPRKNFGGPAPLLSKTPILPSATTGALARLPTTPSPGLAPGTTTAATAGFSFSKVFSQNQDMSKKTQESNEKLQRSIDANTTATTRLVQTINTPGNMQDIMARAVASGLERAQLARGGRLS